MIVAFAEPGVAGLIKFSVGKLIEACQEASAWKILSSIGDIPKYWGGHREVRVVGRAGSDITAEITFAFPGPGNRGLAVISVDERSRTVMIRYVRGPIRGTVVNSVSSGLISSSWEVEPALYLKPLESWLRSHFEEGARHALEKIASEAKC